MESYTSPSQLLAELRDLRASPSRRPDLVTRIGLQLERAHKLETLNNRDVAEAVEQVAIAALETAHLDLADVLIARLSSHYREQPHGLHRVNYLHGMALEARGLVTDAKEFYRQRLRDDETDVAMRKRLAALHLSSPIIELPSASSPPSNKAGNGNPYLSASLSRTEGISLLVSYLDTYYLDLSSWLSLSTAYASLGQYPAALTCLDHAVVLSPHDPFVHLKAAETAYTAGEVQLAWKGFARVVEMSLEPSRDSVVLQGAARRAAYGAKLCIPRLRASASTSTSSAATRPTAAAASTTTDEKAPSSTTEMAVITPDQLDKMDLLLTRLLLDDASTAISSRKGTTTGGAAAELRSWLSGN
ncbi:hypothetical protein JCM8115_005715 [Rhodotorula mucilaginosa]